MFISARWRAKFVLSAETREINTKLSGESRRLDSYKIFTSEAAQRWFCIGSHFEGAPAGKSIRMISHIYSDVVHGNIELPPFIRAIINTEEFQRLRNLRQLGLSYFKFSGATHTRYEHCIGWVISQLVGRVAIRQVCWPSYVEFLFFFCFE